MVKDWEKNVGKTDVYDVFTWKRKRSDGIFGLWKEDAVFVG